VKIASNETANLASNLHVLVTGFGMGSTIRVMYDPYMMVIPDIHQYLSYYTVVVPDGYKENFLCVIIPSDSVKSLRINGQNVDPLQKCKSCSANAALMRL
jgi:hypothetical protein